MEKIFKENRFFLIPYFLFLIFCFSVLLIFTKPALHIILNQANSAFFDSFFKYATHFGDGLVIPVLFVVLLGINYRSAFVFLSASLSTSLIINLFKKVILGDVYRPSKYFELYETYPLHFVDGVELHSLQSFPSGHTGTAFNVFFMLALVLKNKYLKLLSFLCAAIVGYSRVYLSQHFLIDVVVGSITGVLFIFIFQYWFDKSEKQWLNRSVFRKK